MAGQGITQVSELHDENRVGSRVITASTNKQILFVADRDMWLDQAWFRSGTAESDGETYQLKKQVDGTALGGGSPTALTDAFEVHGSGSWVANTKADWTVDTANNFIAAGEVVFIECSTAFQTTTEICVNWRTTTRRQ